MYKMEKIKKLTKKQLKQMSKEALADAYLEQQGIVIEVNCENEDLNRRLEHETKSRKKAEDQRDRFKEELLVFLSKTYGSKSEKKPGTFNFPRNVIENGAELFAELGIIIETPGEQEKGNTPAEEGNPAGGTDNGKEGKEEKQEETKPSGTGSADPGNKQDGQKDSPAEDGQNGKEGEKPKGKSKGPAVKRKAGFKAFYIPKGFVAYEVDGFRYTPEEFRKMFGLREEEMAYLSNVADINTTIETIPAVYYTAVHIRPRVRKANQTLHACIMDSIFNNSVCSPSLLAHLVTQHYGMGMPWYRLSKYLRGQEIYIPRDTMTRWSINASSRWLAPLSRRLRRLLVQRKALQGDETYVAVNASDKSNCYFWMVRTSELDKSGPEIILFVFDETRGEDVIEDILEGFEGTFMSDGYICYKLLGEKCDQILSVLCWSHCRRLYYDVLRAVPNFSTMDESIKNGIPAWHAIQLISEIYKWEKEARAADRDTRLKIRNEKIRPCVDAFFKYIKELKDNDEVCRPGSLLKKAIDYSLNGEDRFRGFLDNPDIPMDNNASERCMIQVSIGRNAWKAIDSARGAESAAIYFSLYETAAAAGANPEVYFRYLFEIMPELCRAHEKEIEDPNNDLAFLDCMMPWSAEYRAYEKQVDRKCLQIITEALTRDNLLHHSPIARPYLANIIETEANGLSALKSLAEELRRDTSPQPEYCKGPVRGAAVPEKHRPEVFLFTKDEPGAGDAAGGENVSASAGDSQPQTVPLSAGTGPGLLNPGGVGDPADADTVSAAAS